MVVYEKEEKQKERQEEAKTITDAFFERGNTILDTKIVLNNKLMKALVYAQNQEKELSEFLNDGRIPHLVITLQNVLLDLLLCTEKIGCLQIL